MTATIKQVEVFGVKMPLVGSFTSGGKSYDVTKCVVVRITDTDGVTGISSIDPSNKSIAPNTAADIAVTIRNVLGPALIGENPDRINLIVEGAAKLTPHQPGAVAGVAGAPLDPGLGGNVNSGTRSPPADGRGRRTSKCTAVRC